MGMGRGHRRVQRECLLARRAACVHGCVRLHSGSCVGLDCCVACLGTYASCTREVHDEGITHLSSLGYMWAGGGVRQYIYGLDIPLVMRVGVRGGGACDHRVSLWGGATPEQKGDVGGECGQKPLSVGSPA